MVQATVTLRAKCGGKEREGGEWRRYVRLKRPGIVDTNAGGTGCSRLLCPPARPEKDEKKNI